MAQWPLPRTCQTWRSTGMVRACFFKQRLLRPPMNNLMSNTLFRRWPQRLRTARCGGLQFRHPGTARPSLGNHKANSQKAPHWEARSARTWLATAASTDRNARFRHRVCDSEAGRSSWRLPPRGASTRAHTARYITNSEVNMAALTNAS